MGMMQEFKDFAVKGNVIDLAVGVIIGGAFGKIVASMVEDVIMPIVGAIFGKIDFSNLFVTTGRCARRHRFHAGRHERSRRACVGLRQLHHRGDQLRHSGFHHLHDGQAGEPTEARRRGRTSRT